MTGTFEDYSIILKDELQARVSRNPRYSMRAFSRDLGVSSARLSRILAGKAVPSRAMALKVGERLGYKDEKLDWYCALVEAQHGRTPERRRRAAAILNRYQNGVFTKQVEAKNSIAWNWYHFAIRRLTQIPEFQSDSKWIANRLGLSVRQAKRAVEEMVKAGALAIIDGKIEMRENYSVHFKGDRNTVRKKMEFDLLANKLPSILGSHREYSHHARHFFAVDRAQIESLKEIIRSFEDQVDDLTYRAEKPDEVVCLSIDLWSLLKSPSVT